MQGYLSENDEARLVCARSDAGRGVYFPHAQYLYALLGVHCSEARSGQAERVTVCSECENIKRFTPCYLSGFYADVDDLRPNEIYKELVMFPVWFLTYRDKDRVSYVVINGQTGKAAGDIPVDVNRYFMGSVLLALPLFGLLHLAGNLQPAVMLVIAGVMAGVCAFFSVKQQKQLRASRPLPQFERRGGEEDGR